ncbi:restriction endonuclease subunit S [Helicobacter suis]|uniref:restriction endonuclease subunit S n=1 Tax=Helicobacter suis TaxID=104628 RepID=UPI001F087D25|nr:restriction endonuclease subunit S [Helicobacter suis]
MKWVRLGEILSLEYGDSLPEYKRITGKYPIMGSNGVVGYHNTFLIRSPAIIVGRKGSAGKVNYMDQDCYPIDTTYFVQLKIECSLKFIYYVLTNLQLEYLKTGGGVPGLNREHVYQILIPLPPLKEQRVIATFLDHKCAKIAACITKKTRMLALLKEYKQALISKITTKGLNPQEHFKPSAVAWLGDIPGHWKVARLKETLIYEQPARYLVKSTAYKPGYKTPVLTAGKTFILGYTDETEGIYPSTKDNPVIIFDDFTTTYRWVDFPFKVKSSAIKILKEKTESVDLKFVYYAMRCIVFKPSDHMRHWITRYSMFKIPLPPLKEQHAIAAFLDHKLAKLDTLIIKLQTQIQGLKDYKSALISEAVLGQIPLKAKHAKMQ